MKAKGTKEFAQTASRAYKSISASQREELRKKCNEQTQPLTVKDMMGARYSNFKNMDQVGDSTVWMSQNKASLSKRV